MARSEKVQKVRKAKSEKKNVIIKLVLGNFTIFIDCVTSKSTNFKEEENGNAKRTTDTFACSELNFYHPPDAHLITQNKN